MNSICRTLLIFVLLLFVVFPASANQEKPLIFGFLPVISAQRLVARFGPLADYLAKKLHRAVHFETAVDYAEFMRRTYKRRYDILFTAPHFYYLAQRKAGYRVLVRVALPTMPAVIVARSDSSIKTLNDLRGKRLATTDPLALGTALVKAYLVKHGINPDKDLTLVTTPTHIASLVSTYKGVTDAASLMKIPFSRARKDIKDHMRIIAQTDGTPHMPISVSPSVSVKDAAIIQNALINLRSSEEGRALLKHLSWPGLVKAVPSDYDQLEWAAKQVKISE